MNPKTYTFSSEIYPADRGGAYVIFPYNVREEFGKGRAKVHVTFNGYPYDGSVVNMGVTDEIGSICYIIGVRKNIGLAIQKTFGDTISVSVQERE